MTDNRGGELTGAELLEIFRANYLDCTRPYELHSYTHASGADEDRIVARIVADGEEVEVEGIGNGPIAALVDGLARSFGVTVRLRDYHEHTMAASADATAAAYIEADVDDEGIWGVGIHPSIVTASLRAILNAVNRAAAAREAAVAAAAAFELED